MSVKSIRGRDVVFFVVIAPVPACCPVHFEPILFVTIQIDKWRCPGAPNGITVRIPPVLIVKARARSTIIVI
jgi:hypothetical protein